MSQQWLQFALIYAASWLVPRGQRLEWRREWRSELCYVPLCEATRFCLGAFQDALWMWRNTERERAVLSVGSPLECLLRLGALAAACSLVTVYPSAVPSMNPLYMLPLSFVFLPAMGFAMGWQSVHGYHVSWLRRLRNWGFFALKVVLLQPAIFCGFVLCVPLTMVPFLPLLALAGYWCLLFRWILTDQRSRCPVCLHLLTHPVRIGTPSGTFLDWYGAESMCSRGHGLLQEPEILASYSSRPHWLGLGKSWRELFSPAARVR